MRPTNSLIVALIAVGALIAIAWFGAGQFGMTPLFGVFVPYLAFLLFIVGFVYKIIKWAKAPVPFRIPTTGGQGKSLPWIKHEKWDTPFTGFQVLVRMFLEVFFFRSLFRGLKAEVSDEPRLFYASAKWLWAGGIVFHYCFLIILLRHFRFFLDPSPMWVDWLATLDGFFEVLIPTVFLTDFGIVIAATYLFVRRVVSPHVRYISLLADYFPLVLILAIAATGILMRQWYKVDLPAVKELATGWFAFNFAAPADGIGVIFYIHLFLVCTLFAYFPFSKLMHAGGVFMSPTRNLASNNRAVRHVNPWDYPVKLHTYEEYEDEFREAMKDAGIPVEKE